MSTPQQSPHPSSRVKSFSQSSLVRVAAHGGGLFYDADAVAVDFVGVALGRVGVADAAGVKDGSRLLVDPRRLMLIPILCPCPADEAWR